MLRHFPKFSIRYSALCLSFTILALTTTLPNAHAQEQTQRNKTNIIDILSARQNTDANETTTLNDRDNTHPAITLTPDRSEIINLERAAASVIIGNPTHLGILADSSTRIILVPRAPGASHFTILDKDGDIVMQRHAIVGAAKQKYIRIRRSCANGGDGCKQTSVFYCPDMCHELMMETGETKAQQDKSIDDTKAAYKEAASEALDEAMNEAIEREPGSQ